MSILHNMCRVDGSGPRTAVNTGWMCDSVSLHEMSLPSAGFWTVLQLQVRGPWGKRWFVQK